MFLVFINFLGCNCLFSLSARTLEPFAETELTHWASVFYREIRNTTCVTFYVVNESWRTFYDNKLFITRLWNKKQNQTLKRAQSLSTIFWVCSFTVLAESATNTVLPYFNILKTCPPKNINSSGDSYTKFAAIKTHSKFVARTHTHIQTHNLQFIYVTNLSPQHKVKVIKPGTKKGRSKKKC